MTEPSAKGKKEAGSGHPPTVTVTGGSFSDPVPTTQSFLPDYPVDHAGQRAHFVGREAGHRWCRGAFVRRRNRSGAVLQIPNGAKQQGYVYKENDDTHHDPPQPVLCDGPSGEDDDQ